MAKKAKKKKKRKQTKTPVIKVEAVEIVLAEDITRIKKQAQFIQVFFSTSNNVTQTCKAIGIERWTYYNWLKDPDFARRINDKMEELLDYAESMIIAAFPTDWRAAYTWLKIKGKSRGWKPDIALAQDDVETEQITIRHVYGKVPKKRKQIESRQIDKENEK